MINFWKRIIDLYEKREGPNDLTNVKKISKPKLLELDLVRAAAILAVLIIHATADATVELALGSGSQAMYLTLNKLSNFAVPVFILLSGLVLFYRYQDDFGGKQALLFYVRRVRQVLFPYLIWSLFYYLYNQWIYDRARLHFDAAEFGELLPWADASYHLYFMIIIVQFYLIFPLLMWMCKAWPSFRRYLVWIGLAVHAGLYAYHYWVRPFDHMASLCINYFSMFALGGWMGLYYERFSGWLRANFAWVSTLTLLIGCAFVGLFVAEGRFHLQLPGYGYQLLFFGYAAFVSMTLIRLCQIALARWKLISRLLTSLGAVSFGVYLMHPAVLTYYKTHVTLPGGSIAMYHAYTFGAFLASLIVPWVLVYAYGRIMKLLRK